MKKLSLLLFLVMLQIAVHAQDAVVSPTNMNLLYSGVANPIEIAVPGITTDKVTATVTNGTITRTAKGWEINPQNMKECIVTVFANNKKIADKSFRVKPLPVPVAIFAGNYTGAVSRENALKNASLEAKIMDFVWDLKYNIVSFNMLIKNGAGDKELSVKGNTLSDVMKSQISSLTRGQSVIFKDIKAMGPDGREKELNPIVLQIN